MDIDSELRKCYRAATLLPDGRSRRGRKTKHDTATRRWCDTVGFPAISMGKRPSADDMAMLRLSPRSSLSGLDLKARDAWSQKHGRDPRSKQQTEAEKLAQQTLLSWARSNLLSALTPSAIRRGRTAAWQIDFGRSWRGYTPRKLALASAPGAASTLPADRSVPPGAFLLWLTGQAVLGRNGSPFKWRFPAHFHLYHGLRELESEGRVVCGNDGPVMLRLPVAAHRAYETYCDIRLAPPDIDDAGPGEEGYDDGHAAASPSPAPAADGGTPAAGALAVPPPLPPIDRVETATPRAQVEFFKSILCEMNDGDRTPYQEWDRLTVSPPDPLCMPCDDGTSFQVKPITFWSHEMWRIDTPCVNEGYAHAAYVSRGRWAMRRIKDVSDDWFLAGRRTSCSACKSSKEEMQEELKELQEELEQEVGVEAAQAGVDGGDDDSDEDVITLRSQIATLEGKLKGFRYTSSTLNPHVGAPRRRSRAIICTTVQHSIRARSTLATNSRRRGATSSTLRGMCMPPRGLATCVATATAASGSTMRSHGSPMAG